MNENEISTVKIILLSLFMAVIGFFLDIPIFGELVFCLTFILFFIPVISVICKACFTYMNRESGGKASDEEKE